MNQKRSHLPRVLIVTPEVTYLPDQNGVNFMLFQCLGGWTRHYIDLNQKLLRHPVIKPMTEIKIETQKDKSYI